MRRHLAVIATVSILVVACNGENRPIADRGTRRALPPRKLAEPLTGALPRKIGEITAAEFKVVLAGIPYWVGGTHTGRCTDAFLCGLGLSKVDVSIQPTFDAANAGIDNVGENGTILLQLKNAGDKNAGGLGRYKLEAGKTYYVIVSSIPNNGARWEIVHFEDNQTEKPQHPTEKENSGTFHGCNHSPVLASSAGFYPCGSSPGLALRDTSSNLQKAALGDFVIIGALTHFAAFLPSFLMQSPGWVSCAVGCCTLEGS